MLYVDKYFVFQEMFHLRKLSDFLVDQIYVYLCGVDVIIWNFLNPKLEAHT